MSLPSAKTFISYGWTSPAHEAWVMTLATRLRQDGIDVTIDKWDLKPGHDANAFMESMVTDPKITKVILVCDANYAAKADGRLGGVGTESQIISPALYGKKSQDKFAAVVTENDDLGAACVPTFYKGRIYFNFVEPDKYEDEYDRLLRWLFDKPLYEKPPVGGIPPHIASGGPTIGTHGKYKRADSLVRSGSATASGTIRDFADSLIPELAKCDLSAITDEIEDDRFVRSLDASMPLLEQVSELFAAVARYDQAGAYAKDAIKVVNSYLPMMAPPPNASSWHSSDFDLGRFLGREAFLTLLGCAIAEDRFGHAKVILQHPYLLKDRIDRSKAGFFVFEQDLGTLSRRNGRLNLRRTSLRADLLKERCEAIGKVSFYNLMQADFLCFLASSAIRESGVVYDYWQPDTLIYSENYDRFDLFTKAESANTCSEIMGIVGVPGVSEFKALVASLIEKNGLPHFGSFFRFPIVQLVNLDRLATRP